MAKDILYGADARNALIAGVDKLFDMGRTTLNITGDASCTMFISRLERKNKAKAAN